MNPIYQSGCEPAESITGLYGPYSPDGVDMGDGRKRGNNTENEKEERAGLDHEYRVQRIADFVVLALFFPWPLSVALVR